MLLKVHQQLDRALIVNRDFLENDSNLDCLGFGERVLNNYLWKGRGEYFHSLDEECAFFFFFLNYRVSVSVYVIGSKANLDNDNFGVGWRLGGNRASHRMHTSASPVPSWNAHIDTLTHTERERDLSTWSPSLQPQVLSFLRNTDS